MIQFGNLFLLIFKSKKYLTQKRIYFILIIIISTWRISKYFTKNYPIIFQWMIQFTSISKFIFLNKFFLSKSYVTLDNFNMENVTSISKII